MRKKDESKVKLIESEKYLGKATTNPALPRFKAIINGFWQVLLDRSQIITFHRQYDIVMTS